MNQPKLIDIHSHINFNAFKDDGKEIIQRTLDGGVWTILVGSQIDTSERAVWYAEQYEKGIYAAVGLHPIHLVEAYFDVNEVQNFAFTTRHEVFDYDRYKKIAEHPKTVAIGECGLDYFRVPNLATRPPSEMDEWKIRQKDTFRQQVALAREVKKPLMIHCRNAYEDLIQILKEENGEDIGGDIHFFAGTWDIAKQFLDLNFNLSFTGVLTFTHDYDEVVEKAPLECLMVETDAPYVAPVPHRGKRNEPLYVEYTAKRIAEIKKLPEDRVFRQLVENTRRVFRI
jgi:TatD DNase family protein